MRIGLDAHLLGKGIGGVERVVHELVARVPSLLPQDEFVVFINRHYVVRGPVPENVTYVRLAWSDPLLQRSLLLPWLARSHRLDLLHVQRVAPPWGTCPVLVHIHDLLPLTEAADHPGFRNALVRRLTAGSIHRATQVLTVSRTVAAEIADLFPHARTKVAAIPNGISAENFYPAAPGAARSQVHADLGVADAPYLLYLGAITPRKNLEVAIEGYRQWSQSLSPRPRLILAGMNRSPEFGEHLSRLLAKNGLEKDVRFSGFRTDAECLALLQHARVFLAPSRGEGFDLPPLEAMAAGVPVICSDIPVHRELIDAGAARFFPTGNPGALAQEIGACWDDAALRQRMRSAGLACARSYTWNQAARSLAELYTRRQLTSAKTSSSSLYHEV